MANLSRYEEFVNFIKKNKIKLLLIVFVIFGIASIYFKLFHSPYFYILLIILIGIFLFIYKNSDEVSKFRKIYLFFNKYVKAFFYSILGFLLILFVSIFIPKIFADNYYLIISDLPSSYIENGYTKEVLKTYFDNHINNINKSENENLGIKDSYNKFEPLDDSGNKFEPFDDSGKIKMEVFGNSIYIDELVFLFRKIIGNDNTIYVHFGADNDLGLFCYGKIKNGNKEYNIKTMSNKLPNNGFSENNIHQITHYFTYSCFKITHFRKLISYYINNHKELSYLNNEIVNKSLILTNDDEAFFYRVYGTALFNNARYSDAEDMFLKSLSIYERNNLTKGKDFQDLLESYSYNMQRTGKALEAIELLENYKINNKIFKGTKAFLYNVLGEDQKAIKLYEEALKSNDTKAVNNDSVSSSQKPYFIANLMGLYMKKAQYANVIKLGLKGFELTNDSYFLYEVQKAYSFSGNNKKAFEIYGKLNELEIKEIKPFIKFKVSLSIFENGSSNDNSEFSNLTDLELLAHYYPNYRVPLKDLMRLNIDSVIVNKTYRDYIINNPNDFDIKFSYLQYLINNGFNTKNLANNLLNQQLKRTKTINENLYFTIYNNELNIILKQRDNFKLAQFIDKMNKDKIIHNAEEKILKANLGTSKYLLFDEFNHFYYDLKVIEYLDSIAEAYPKFKKVVNLTSAEILKVEIYKSLNIKPVDSLIMESLKRDYNNKFTWFLWGISKDFKGLYNQADEKYNHSNDLDNNFNSYFEAQSFFDNRGYYKLAEINYQKGLTRDSIINSK